MNATAAHIEGLDVQELRWQDWLSFFDGETLANSEGPGLSS